MCPCPLQLCQSLAGELEAGRERLEKWDSKMNPFPWFLPRSPDHIPHIHALTLSLLLLVCRRTFSLCLYLYTNPFFFKCHLHALTFSLPLSTSSLHHLHPILPPLRPLQPGSVGRWHVWPEAARSAAPRGHPDPEAARGGGCLRGLQHRAQCSQLLPARMFTYRSM